MAITERVGEVEWLSSEIRPKTLRLCNILAETKEPAILTSASAPFHIVATNRAWREMCGFGTDAIGKTPSILQGELTDMKKAAIFRRALGEHGSARTTLVNYTKDGRAFVHKLKSTKMVSQDGNGDVADANLVLNIVPYLTEMLDSTPCT